MTKEFTSMSRDVLASLMLICACCAHDAGLLTPTTTEWLSPASELLNEWQGHAHLSLTST
jgi:hypothetical protein